MTPEQLHAMIQRIKELPDDILIRVLQAATSELLKRTTQELRRLKDITQKP